MAHRYRLLGQQSTACHIPILLEFRSGVWRWTRRRAEDTVGGIHVLRVQETFKNRCRVALLEFASECWVPRWMSFDEGVQGGD